MCFDGGLILGLLSAGIGAMQAVAQQQQQQVEFEAKQQAYNENYQNSLAAGRNEIKQSNIRQIEEAKLASQKEGLQIMEGAQKGAEASVAAAGSNVAGLAVDNIIADVGRTTNRNRATLQTNWEMKAAQMQTEAEAIQNRTQSRIGQVAQPIPPSPMGMVLGVAGAGLKAFGSISKRGGGGGGGEEAYS